jgi:iron complex transport system ATP-binding protein
MPEGGRPLLEARGVGYSIQDRWLVRGVDLTILPGSFTALVGPNGAGKTTLLRILSGEIPPTEGELRVDGECIRKSSPERLARFRALLSQHRSLAFPFSGEEVVRLGRHPHRTPRHHDDRIVERSLDTVGAAPLRHRSYPTLSGGEATRVDMARVLAQEPSLVLLDEPTNHLDPRHQHEVLELCAAMAGEGCAVVAVLHDLNLAALHAHRMMVLCQGETAAWGTPAEILTPERIEEVFGLQCQVWRHPSGCPWIVPCRRGQGSSSSLDHTPHSSEMMS